MPKSFRELVTEKKHHHHKRKKKRCPYCGMPVGIGMSRCPHCGQDCDHDADDAQTSNNVPTMAGGSAPTGITATGAAPTVNEDTKKKKKFKSVKFEDLRKIKKLVEEEEYPYSGDEDLLTDFDIDWPNKKATCKLCGDSVKINKYNATTSSPSPKDWKGSGIDYYNVWDHMIESHDHEYTTNYTTQYQDHISNTRCYDVYFPSIGYHNKPSVTTAPGSKKCGSCFGKGNHNVSWGTIPCTNCGGTGKTNNPLIENFPTVIGFAKDNDDASDHDVNHQDYDQDHIKCQHCAGSGVIDSPSGSGTKFKCLFCGGKGFLELRAMDEPPFIKEDEESYQKYKDATITPWLEKNHNVSKLGQDSYHCNNCGETKMDLDATFEHIKTHKPEDFADPRGSKSKYADPIEARKAKAAHDLERYHAGLNKRFVKTNVNEDSSSYDDLVGKPPKSLLKNKLEAQKAKIHKTLKPIKDLSADADRKRQNRKNEIDVAHARIERKLSGQTFYPDHTHKTPTQSKYRGLDNKPLEDDPLHRSINSISKVVNPGDNTLKKTKSNKTGFLETLFGRKKKVNEAKLLDALPECPACQCKLTTGKKCKLCGENNTLEICENPYCRYSHCNNEDCGRVKMNESSDTGFHLLPKQYGWQGGADENYTGTGSGMMSKVHTFTHPHPALAGMKLHVHSDQNYFSMKSGTEEVGGGGLHKLPEFLHLTREFAAQRQPKRFGQKELTNKDSATALKHINNIDPLVMMKSQMNNSLEVKGKLVESLSPSDSSSTYVDDFVHSKNSKFKGKPKKERIRMALGAYYSAKRKAGLNEDDYDDDYDEVEEGGQHDPDIYDLAIKYGYTKTSSPYSNTTPGGDWNYYYHHTGKYRLGVSNDYENDWAHRTARGGVGQGFSLENRTKGNGVEELEKHLKSIHGDMDDPRPRKPCGSCWGTGSHTLAYSGTKVQCKNCGGTGKTVNPLIEAWDKTTPEQLHHVKVTNYKADIDNRVAVRHYPAKKQLEIIHFNKDIPVFHKSGEEHEILGLLKSKYDISHNLLESVADNDEDQIHQDIAAVLKKHGYQFHQRHVSDTDNSGKVFWVHKNKPDLAVYINDPNNDPRHFAFSHRRPYIDRNNFGMTLPNGMNNAATTDSLDEYLTNFHKSDPIATGAKKCGSCFGKGNHRVSWGTIPCKNCGGTGKTNNPLIESVMEDFENMIKKYGYTDEKANKTIHPDSPWNNSQDNPVEKMRFHNTEPYRVYWAEQNNRWVHRNTLTGRNNRGNGIEDLELLLKKTHSGKTYQSQTQLKADPGIATYKPCGACWGSGKITFRNSGTQIKCYKCRGTGMSNKPIIESEEERLKWIQQYKDSLEPEGTITPVPLGPATETNKKQRRCKHEFAKQQFAGYYWCQKCLIPGTKKKT